MLKYFACVYLNVRARVIAVTGSPAAGKTTLAGKLAGELEAKCIDLKDFAHSHGLIVGRDDARGADVVDEDALHEKLEEELKKVEGDAVLDGLLSSFTPATHIIVLRCSPLVLLGRLRERGYSKEKIKENLEAEVQGVCLYDSLWCGNVLEVDASDGIEVEEILGWLARGGKQVEETDWLSVWARMLEEGF